MKILVINSGSSSIKFQLINMDSGTVLAKGLLERIGIPGSVLIYYQGERKHVIERDVPHHEEGIDLIVHCLTDTGTGVIKDKGEIFAIGHRVVHAGEKFNGTVPISDAVLAALKECIPLAPLHNPPNITGIEACQKILPGIPMAGTFDTAFHQTMPEKAYIYPIPYDYYRRHKIRRYGFHGTSHFYVAKQGAKALGRKLEELKIITCHLGNGSSMAAIQNGTSVDTTMGYTPLEGLAMGTRCGDVDPAIPLVLQRTMGMSHEQVDAVLNRKSGMLGISEVSSDMRDINDKAAAGHPQARLALEIFAYRIKKYIGAYIAAMNGVDLVIFTAGIGERGRAEREMILKDMESLGIVFDPEANQEAFGRFGVISAKGSRVCVMVIPTNEELEIAEQTLRVIGQRRESPPAS
ncbi:MAG: acetate kinase [Candidatus Aminicenantes bacterium]|nr:acetate kinase [Candidatus Aminicenantes bacterium]